MRTLLPHVFAYVFLLHVLAALSYAGRGWGYFVLYAGALAVFALVVGLACVVVRVRHPRAEAGPRTRRLLRRSLRSFAYAQLTLLVVLTATATTARLGSGPVGPFPGGAFGELVVERREGLPAPQGEEVQLQVPGDPPYTITTHAFLVEGALYVGADFAFPFKRWVYTVARDANVLVRIDGRVYARRATRIADPAESRRILEAVSRQRGVGPEDWLTDVWFFRMDPAP